MECCLDLCHWAVERGEVLKKLGNCVCVCVQEAGAGSADHDGAAAQPGGGEPGQPDGNQKPAAHGIAVSLLPRGSPGSFSYFSVYIAIQLKRLKNATGNHRLMASQ